MGYIWEGLVERITGGPYATNTKRWLSFTTRGSLRVAEVEGANTERLRSNMLFWGGCQVLGSGIAPDTAIPTTTAKLALFNSDTVGTGKSIILGGVSYCLGSGTPTAGLTLYLSVSKGPLATAVSSNATDHASVCRSGKSTATSIALWGTAVTLPSGSLWVAVRPGTLNAAANIGEGVGAFQDPGVLLIPPGYAVGFALVGEAGTTPKFPVSAWWSEYVVDVE